MVMIKSGIGPLLLLVLVGCSSGSNLIYGSSTQSQVSGDSGSSKVTRSDQAQIRKPKLRVTHKVFKTIPPQALIPKGTQLGDSYGYDFNQDGVTDWVMIDKDTVDVLIIQLSSKGKSYKTFRIDSFDPDKYPQSNNFDWKVHIKVLPNGELFIKNNNTSPHSSSDTMNTYRFRFVKDQFILYYYTHGYTSHRWGNYRKSYLFDIQRHRYKESDKQRCDYHPQKPCQVSKTARLSTKLPNISLRNIDNYDVNALEKFIIK